MFLQCVLVEALIGVVLLVRVAVFDVAVQTRARGMWDLTSLVKRGLAVWVQSFLRLKVAFLWWASVLVVPNRYSGCYIAFTG